MKVKDAQKLLNVSRATVHNWIRSGKLKLNRVLQNGYMDINDESHVRMNRLKRRTGLSYSQKTAAS